MAHYPSNTPGESTSVMSTEAVFIEARTVYEFKYKINVTCLPTEQQRALGTHSKVSVAILHVCATVVSSL